MGTWNRIIIGAGLYGLYAALYCAKKGERVLVLEREDAPFTRATYINQARVHMGYHYPRSLATAKKSANYFERFVRDYSFCILKEFDQIYATSSRFSWTNATQFKKFCDASGIRCDYADPERYFRDGMCDGAFLTEEYTYDAIMLRDYLLSQIGKHTDVEIRYHTMIETIQKDDAVFRLTYKEGGMDESPYVLNATYAATNQIARLAGFETFQIKYELCEIILCKPSEELSRIGLTVMDGPFFSIMPFGMTAQHSLTSVTFTPHITSYEEYPTFPCQKDERASDCFPDSLGNCNKCPVKPESAWPYMSGLALKYMRPEYGFVYAGSLYSMKPILKSSEMDDSRPTVIRTFSNNPTFVSVLSGKINTVYDLDEILD